jgi:hypothetical protein
VSESKVKYVAVHGSEETGEEISPAIEGLVNFARELLNSQAYDKVTGLVRTSPDGLVFWCAKYLDVDADALGAALRAAKLKFK